MKCITEHLFKEDVDVPMHYNIKIMGIYFLDIRDIFLLLFVKKCA